MQTGCKREEKSTNNCLVHEQTLWLVSAIYHFLHTSSMSDKGMDMTNEMENQLSTKYVPFWRVCGEGTRRLVSWGSHPPGNCRALWAACNPASASHQTPPTPQNWTWSSGQCDAGDAEISGPGLLVSRRRDREETNVDFKRHCVNFRAHFDHLTTISTTQNTAHSLQQITPANMPLF